MVDVYLLAESRHPKARTSLCRLGGNGGLLSNVPVFSDDHPALVVVAPPCYMHSNSVAVHIAAELDKSPARRFLFGVKEIVCGCVILICHICVSYWCDVAGTVCPDLPPTCPTPDPCQYIFKTISKKAY